MSYLLDKFHEIRKVTVTKDNIYVEKSTNNRRVLPSSDILTDDILIPKDSIEILNELKPGITITTELKESSKTVMASVKINENTYVEYGKTQSLAAQAVAESALKDIFFEQIKSTMFNDDDFQYNTNSWKLLGSLAMRKLIEEWLKFYMTNNKYKNIFEIPTPSKTSESSNNKLSQNQNAEANKNDSSLEKSESSFKGDKENTAENKKKEKLKKKNTTVDNSKKNPSNKLLANKVLTDSTNACSVLNELVQSNLKFVDLNQNKDKPPFKFAVVTDNAEYISDPAATKKEAKQNVAKKVLIKKFGYVKH